MSLALTWPWRLCLLRVLLEGTTTATGFLLSKYAGGGGATPAFSDQLAFLQFTWEVTLPLSRGVFSHCYFYKLSPSKVAGCVPPLQLSPAGSFIYSSVRDSPPPHLWHSGHPSLFGMCLFCCCCLLRFFFFFPWVGVSLSRGLCWSGPGVSVGVLQYCLAHLLVCIFPCGLGAGVW
jgi:hypothetical protein